MNKEFLFSKKIHNITKNAFEFLFVTHYKKNWNLQMVYISIIYTAIEFGL